MAKFKLYDNGSPDKDKQIIDICKDLTEKGYVTLASCEGHPYDADFIIYETNSNIYVYMDPYIFFKKVYKFKSLPKHWGLDAYGSDANRTIRVKPFNNSEPVLVRKATNDEIEKFGYDFHKVKELDDGDAIIDRLEISKKMYLDSLKVWVDSLPNIEDEDENMKSEDNKETLNEATSNSSNAAKRKEITDLIVSMYNGLEKGGTKNSTRFLEYTKNMSDTQFIAYMTSIINDPKKHLYFEIEAFENEPDYGTIEDVANNIIGEEYTHLYDYIAFPHLSKDPKNPEYTVHKVFNGYINLRRVQQLVNNKNHIPTSNNRRDPKTNQVVFESKAARIADVEQFAMICHGTKNVLKEFFGPRGGDPVMRDEMNHQIATTGTAQLSEMHDSKLNKTSLNTANVYLLAAAIESDLVTKNGILPRTIINQYREARTLDRDSAR